MARPTIILTRSEIAAGFSPEAAIFAIEQAMAAYEKGEDYLPPKAIYELPIGEPGALAACITGMTDAAGLLSMKVGQERTSNPSHGLPTTSSWVLVFEPQTGELLMICDGTLPTMLRTAAAAAVAAKHLARQDVSVLSVIGAGQLGKQCVRQVSSVRNFEKILLYDKNRSSADKAARDLVSLVSIPIEVVDAQVACENADVLVTATNSREPIVMSDWVRAGTHLSCMGSDMADKIECDMSLLSRCRLIADKIEHAIQRGEVSQAIQQGVLDEKCYAGTLGQVINGEVVGRTNATEVTMFDGVGIGIQDTTIVRTIYDQALEKSLGTSLQFS